jgi:2-polyprenyl-3-methyl-5-hydroxy-6-metoxy-1,4-benzoquinol methylase
MTLPDGDSGSQGRKTKRSAVEVGRFLLVSVMTAPAAVEPPSIRSLHQSNPDGVGPVHGQEVAARVADCESPSKPDSVKPVTVIVDPEGVHLAALRRLGDFRDMRILELGCGDGRLTPGIATDAAHVLAFDPDADEVTKARESLPAEFARRVTYKVATGQAIKVKPWSFDLALFSWSLC